MNMCPNVTGALLGEYLEICVSKPHLVAVRVGAVLGQRGGSPEGLQKWRPLPYSCGRVRPPPTSQGVVIQALNAKLQVARDADDGVP